MLIRRITAAALALTAAVFALPARATITVTNSSFGANTLIQDSATGLSWLQVNQTTGMSYNAVAAQLITGGTFQGYRYATLAETQQLFQDYGVPLNEMNGSANGNIAAAVSSMLATLGTGEVVNGSPETYALIADSTAPGTHEWVYYASVGNGSSGFVVGTNLSSLGDTQTQINTWGPTHSLLVADVPEPLSLALFGLGAFGTIGLRRARRGR